MRVRRTSDGTTDIVVALVPLVALLLLIALIVRNYIADAIQAEKDDDTFYR